jgi:hypothetical protein
MKMMKKNKMIKRKTFRLSKTSLYNLTGDGRVNLTAEPERVVHMMTGSEPTLSVVALPLTEGALPGKVTGTVVPHLLPVEVTVTATMDLPSWE